jgi:hypothetical protein
MAKMGAAAKAGGGFLKKMLGDLIRPAARRAARNVDDVARKQVDDVAARAGGKAKSKTQKIIDAFRGNRRRTQAGESFYDPTDVGTKHAARTLPPEPGKFTVDMHGDPQNVFIGNDAYGPDDLATYMESPDCRWNGGPVRLMSCETGQGPNPFAQQLSDRLGVPVTAPDQLAWSDATGVDFVSSQGGVDLNGNPIPTVPHDGSWITFTPNPKP